MERGSQRTACGLRGPMRVFYHPLKSHLGSGASQRGEQSRASPPLPRTAHSAMNSPLSLTPVRLDSLPQSSTESAYQSYVDAAVAAARDLVNSLPSPTSSTLDRWAAGKTFQTGGPAPVHTYSTRSASQAPPGSGETEGLKWHARRSVHRGESAPSYEAFERGLLRDHSVNEVKYIESCTEARGIKVIKEGEFEGAFFALSSRVLTLTCVSLPILVWQTLCKCQGRTRTSMPADQAFAQITKPFPPAIATLRSSSSLSRFPLARPPPTHPALFAPSSSSRSPPNTQQKGATSAAATSRSNTSESSTTRRAVASSGSWRSARQQEGWCPSSSARRSCRARFQRMCRPSSSGCRSSDGSSTLLKCCCYLLSVRKLL